MMATLALAEPDDEISAKHFSPSRSLHIARSRNAVLYIEPAARPPFRHAFLYATPRHAPAFRPCTKDSRALMGAIFRAQLAGCIHTKMRMPAHGMVSRRHLCALYYTTPEYYRAPAPFLPRCHFLSWLRFGQDIKDHFSAILPPPMNYFDGHISSVSSFSLCRLPIFTTARSSCFGRYFEMIGSYQQLLAAYDVRGPILFCFDGGHSNARAAFI